MNININIRLTKLQAIWIIWTVVSAILSIVALIPSQEGSPVLFNDIFGFSITFLTLELLATFVLLVGWVLGPGPKRIQGEN